MDVTVAIGDIAGFKADAIVVEAFEGEQGLENDTARVDQAMGGAITQLVGLGEIKGKLNQMTVIHTLGKLPATRIAVVGLGKKTSLTVERVRSAIAETCRALRKRGVTSVGVMPLGVGSAGIDSTRSAHAITEGALLGLYVFRKHITRDPEFGEIKQLTIVDTDAARLATLQDGVRRGRIFASATISARDLVNEPSNHMTPTHMAEAASRIARTHGLELTVLEKEQASELGMGAFLGVAQGSQQPPKFIVLRYNGRDSAENDLALIGKAITFDSGGISLKPSEGMGDMKGDMAGGAAVMAAIGAVAELRPRINVMAIIPATENMPGGTALKPGDVLKSMGGKTIEIITTDAEGRLTFADAVAYARRQGARNIVDIATLTGAMRVALGDVCSGAFTNNQELVDRVISAGNEAGERIWQMPMYDEYKEQNRSDVADIKNSGGRYAGAITAAQFIAEFAEDTPWVHLDIAGTNITEREYGYRVKGATGVPVRTLINLVLAMA